VAQGAPIKVVTPKPSFGFGYFGAALGWAKHPDAALVFLDYLMSSRGQEAWNGTGGLASPLPGIPGAVDASSVTPYDPSAYTTDKVKAVTATWNALFNG
jgi:iron(III) transport system substrate-binding protein